MKKLFNTVLILGLALPLAGAAGVRPSGENILLDPLEGNWKPGYQQTKGPTSILEFVRGQETVQAWTEMATLLTMGGEKNADLERHVQNVRDVVAQRCLTGGKVTVIDKKKRSGLPARLISVECGAYQKDKPESYLALLIAGRDALYSFQRARKTPRLDAKTIKAWTPFLDKLKICDTRDPARPCEAGQIIDAR